MRNIYRIGISASCPPPPFTARGQKYVSKLDEIRQVEDFLHRQGVERLAMMVVSSIGTDLALAFLTQTKLPVEHAFFDGGQFAKSERARAVS